MATLRYTCNKNDLHETIYRVYIYYVTTKKYINLQIKFIRSHKNKLYGRALLHCINILDNPRLNIKSKRR